MSFTDKVAIVTGASSGIGVAIAIKFANEGAKVALVGRNKDKLNKVAEKCEQKGNEALIITADVSQDDDAKRIVSSTVNHFGKLDVLVNNAGILAVCSILADNALETFDKTIATNLRAVVHLTHLAIPYLIETKGNIINISSIMASAVYYNMSFSYGTSKAGVDHFTRCAALELGSKGVRINNINPGPVKTDILTNSGVTVPEVARSIWQKHIGATALGKLPEVEEVADLAAFLASDKAKSITGASYSIDSGCLLKGFVEV